MTKELKLSFALYAIFTAIIMAWKTLLYFFSGVGLNFVAILALAVVSLLLLLKHEQVKKRTMDLFIVACVFVVLEFIVYIPFEFSVSGYDFYRGFMIYQNVITFLGILFFAYIAFRFITEYLNKKITFVEYLLGNRNKSGSSKVAKERKNKELENGSLEEKPSKLNEVSVKEPVEELDTVEEESSLEELLQEDEQQETVETEEFVEE